MKYSVYDIATIIYGSITLSDATLVNFENNGFKAISCVDFLLLLHEKKFCPNAAMA